MISVALCTYNGEKYLEEQLQSILKQTKPVDEIVVCDDRSTDRTIEILKKYRKIDSRFKIFRNHKNLGTIKNFEKAINLTSGDFIFLSDQDDVWYKDKVEGMMNFFSIKPQCLLLFSNGNIIDEKGNLMNSTLWDKWKFDSNCKIKWNDNKNAIIDLLNNQNKVTGATAAFRSSLKKEILPIKPPKGYWHDTWIALHAAYRNGLFFLDKVTINYRIHDNQQVGERDGGWKIDRYYIKNKEFNKYIKKTFPEYTKYSLPVKRNIFVRIMRKIKCLIFSND